MTCRIWDLIIRDGESFLLKTALGILSLYEEPLLKETDFVHIAQFLSKLPDDVNCDKLFDKIEVWIKSYIVMYTEYTVCVTKNLCSDHQHIDLKEDLPQPRAFLVTPLLL